MIMNIGKYIRISKNNLLTTIAYRINGETTYALEGSIFIAGAAIQWLRDSLKIINSAEETEDLYKKNDKSQQVYLVLLLLVLVHLTGMERQEEQYLE